MRFMILVKANADSEAMKMPSQEMFTAMADYHEQLARAGVLLDGSGLRPSKDGWRVKYDGKKRTVVDGPFAETRELVAGYTIIQVKDEAEARAWVARFPNPHDDSGEIEVRRLFEIEDFGESPTLDRFRELGIGSEKK